MSSKAPTSNGPAFIERFYASSFSYNIFLAVWATAINTFFREIRPRGAFNIPRDGPVIFVAAPHHNQFLDPVLLAMEVYRETQRRVSFLIAAKSMKRKAIGFFAKLMCCIPVSRAADDAKPGTGKMRLSPDDPCTVFGEGTKFLAEFTPKMQIMLPRSVGSPVAEVIQVISDTELKIKREFGGENGKGTSRIREKADELKIQGVDGLDFKLLPFVDQQETFRHVYQRLTEGACIGIFPEGGSHDRTDLLPFKAGVSIMALGAMANNPNVKVKLVPVGLSYFHAHRFRSRAVIEFGPALDVPEEFVEKFKQGGPEKREAVSKFLDLVYEALKTVTIRASDYDTLMLIQAARRLYRPPGHHLTLSQVVELNKRFLHGYSVFKEDPRLQALLSNVLKYNRLLLDLGIRDHQVPRAQRASWKTLGLLLYRAGLLSVWSIFALPGVILNGPIFLIASILSKKKAEEALAASVVKIHGRDVIASWKVLISLGVTPILYSFYAIVATIIAVKSNAPWKWRLLASPLTMTALPAIGYAALKFGEAGIDVFKSLRPLIVSLMPGQHQYLERLKVMRQTLSNELMDIINEFGPKLYDDFDKNRVLFPSSSVPTSSGKPGLWQRKSGAAAGETQENLLAHPMNWLDERLFGWSRSAGRGTSAWAGLPPLSRDISRTASPEASDDEDTGDYDNVLSVLRSDDGHITPNRARSRSQHGSYADLQKLRMTGTQWQSQSPNWPTQPGSPTEGGLHRRERRESLSDRVMVERIGALDPREHFKDCTDDINSEIRKKKPSTLDE
ncbi:glycerol-3-phosphate O-acyltransferase [Multifurca ochricompacta]|uniref:Glycerol-3-phosphate O-acyltransferase n=1 Tax=Multifurca ochricompacta TaxID=376703 RepID=A0AAD4MAK0_9AGAM|nr:glycerol-3-phosphate O-acyltransferase [Multifurca ochricompacta]